jgi:hypothetical protein
LTQLSWKKPGVWVSFLLAVEMTGARLRVVPGAKAHTKEVTGLTRLNDGRGPVV